METSLVDWQLIGFVYPVELLLGELIHLMIGEDGLEKQKKEYYILKSGNIINQVFVYYGNLVFFFLFGFIVWFQIYFQTTSHTLLPGADDSSRSSSSPVKKSLMKQYAVKYVLKNLMLFFIFNWIDILFVITGGFCSDESETFSAAICRQNGGEWKGGFDISGHFCFIMNLSMILWIELLNLKKYIKEEGLEYLVNMWVKLAVTIILAVLFIWIFMLFITAIYYHTFLEKILGCALGYVCPYILYWIIPNNENLNYILYI